MRAENAIRGTKIFRTVQEKYGNYRRRYDLIIRDMVCGVVLNQAIPPKRAADRASPPGPGGGPTDLTVNT